MDFYEIAASRPLHAPLSPCRAPRRTARWLTMAPARPGPSGASQKPGLRMPGLPWPGVSPQAARMARPVFAAPEEAGAAGACRGTLLPARFKPPHRRGEPGPRPGLPGFPVGFPSPPPVRSARGPASSAPAVPGALRKTPERLRYGQRLNVCEVAGACRAALFHPSRSKPRQIVKPFQGEGGCRCEAPPLRLPIAVSACLSLFCFLFSSCRRFLLFPMER